MKVEQGLLSTKLSSEEQICQGDNCSRLMKYDDSCTVDVSNSMIYCEPCGSCERYSRKKQEQRENAGILETPLIKGLDY